MIQKARDQEVDERVEHAVWTQLRLYADVAHDSDPLTPYIAKLVQVTKRGHLEAQKKIIRALARRVEAMDTVKRLDGVPWPVPEELERPNWRFVLSRQGRYCIGHWSDVPDDPPPSPADRMRGFESERVDPWISLIVHLTEPVPRKLDLGVGWSVRSRVIVVFSERL